MISLVDLFLPYALCMHSNGITCLHQAARANAAAAAGGAWLSSNCNEASVLALAEPVWPAVRSILACPGLPLPTHCQLAIKVRTAPPVPGAAHAAAAALDAIPSDAHIDGLHAPGNGVPVNTIRNFTLLVGVALSDMPAPRMGNLGVFPGSHLAMEQAVNQMGVVQAVGILSQVLPAVSCCSLAPLTLSCVCLS